MSLILRSPAKDNSASFFVTLEFLYFQSHVRIDHVSISRHVLFIFISHVIFRLLPACCLRGEQSSLQGAGEALNRTLVPSSE